MFYLMEILDFCSPKFQCRSLDWISGAFYFEVNVWWNCECVQLRAPSPATGHVLPFVVLEKMLGLGW